MNIKPHRTREQVGRYIPGTIYLHPAAGIRRAIQLHRARTGWAGPVKIIAP